jgi:hypothetical protein
LIARTEPSVRPPSGNAGGAEKEGSCQRTSIPTAFTLEIVGKRRSCVVGEEDRSFRPAQVHINSSDVAGIMLSHGPNSATVDATNDYWGTSDIPSIEAKIHDCRADLNLSCVTFRPFLQSPFCSAALAVPGGTPTATPTNCPEATATPTPTPTPTPIPTPTPTRTTLPSAFAFSVQSVKVAYGSAKLENVAHRASRPRIRLGQKVKLCVFFQYNGVQQPQRLPYYLGLRVQHSGKTVLYVEWHSNAVQQENDVLEGYSVYFTPHIAGSFTFSGTLFANGKHKHKLVAFTATMR